MVAALRVLVAEIQSGDGVANAAIAEAADRIKELSRSIERIRDAVLNERYQLAEAGLDCDQVNAVLGVIDDLDARVLSPEPV